MTFVDYLHLVNRLGIRRSEIDLWLLDKGHLLAPRRREVMSEIASLLGEADAALYHLQRRIEVLNSELHRRDLEIEKSRKNLDRLMQTML